MAPKNVRELNFMPLALSGLMVVGAHLALLPVFLLPLKDKFYTYLSLTLPGICVTYIVIGLPIFASLWDESKNTVVSIITLSNDLIMTPIYLILAKIYQIRRDNAEKREKGELTETFSWRILLQILKTVVTSSIVIGNLCGMAWSLTRLQLPLFLIRLMEYMGDIVLPLSLFCVGGFLAQHSMIACHWLEFIVCMLVRHVVCPLITALLAASFRTSGELARQCIVLTALPSGVMTYLMSENSGIGPGVASTMIFWTTIAHVPMIILWTVILDKLNLFM